MSDIPWFKVDDTFSSHPKARAAGLQAVGLWAVSGAYASQYLTEGHVPEWFVASWPGGRKVADRLVSAGLWEEAEGGWRFHQWEERQPTKEQVEADRSATRERQQRWRDSKRAKAVTDAVDNGVTNGVDNASPSLPDPTVLPTEVLKELTTLPRKRGTRLANDWAPGTADVGWQRSADISDFIARRELPKFIDYWTAKPGNATKLDWSATWRNWLRTAVESTPGRPSATGTPRPNGWEFGMGN